MLRWLHLGINNASVQEAEKVAHIFQDLFQFENQEKGNSIFTCNNQIELMCQPGKGEKGHIGLLSDNFDRDLDSLRQKGIALDESTAAYFQGQLMSIYLEMEIAGFAVHIVRGC